MKIFSNPYEVIRLLSGMFNNDPNEMSTRLYYCCLIARYKLGDIELEVVNDMLQKIGIKLETEVES